MLSYSLAHWAIVEGIWSCFICSSIIYGFLFFFFFYQQHKTDYLIGLYLYLGLLMCAYLLFFHSFTPVFLLSFTDSPLRSSSPPPNPEEWVSAVLYGPFPGEEALKCSPSHSLPVQWCVLINSYQSSSCIQMLWAAQYWLHWKEKMKKTKQAVETKRKRERQMKGERERERGHRVDKGRRNNGLMVIEDGQNNHW